MTNTLLRHDNGFLLFSNGDVDPYHIVTRDGNLICFSGVEREYMIRTCKVPPLIRAKLLHEGRAHWRQVFAGDDAARKRCHSPLVLRTSDDIEWCAKGYADVEAEALLVAFGVKEHRQALPPGKGFGSADYAIYPPTGTRPAPCVVRAAEVPR